jgi:hypothetical protein
MTQISRIDAAKFSFQIRVHCLAPADDDRGWTGARQTTTDVWVTCWGVATGYRAPFSRPYATWPTIEKPCRLRLPLDNNDAMRHTIDAALGLRRAVTRSALIHLHFCTQTPVTCCPLQLSMTRCVKAILNDPRFLSETGILENGVSEP